MRGISELQTASKRSVREFLGREPRSVVETPGIGAAQLYMVQIVGYGTGDLGVLNSVLQCRRFDEQGDLIGDVFDVFVQSFDPNDGVEYRIDLSVTTTHTRFPVGRQVPVANMVFTIETVTTSRPMFIGFAERFGCN